MFCVHKIRNPDKARLFGRICIILLRLDTHRYQTMVCFKHRKLRANYSNRKNYSFNNLNISDKHMMRTTPKNVSVLGVIFECNSRSSFSRRCFLSRSSKRLINFPETNQGADLLGLTVHVPMPVFSLVPVCVAALGEGAGLPAYHPIRWQAPVLEHVAS